MDYTAITPLAHAIAICAALAAPASAGADAPSPATPVKADRPATAVIALTTSCGDLPALEGVARHVATALVARGGFHPLHLDAAPARTGDLAHWAALLESGEKSYFQTQYAEASRQLAAAVDGLLKHPSSVQEDAKRWTLIDAGAAYAALASLAQGDEKQYLAQVGWIALRRPAATYGVKFPPRFRKAFEEARDESAATAAAPLTVRADAASWRVRLNGTDRGQTPLTLKVHPGRHFLGVVSPEGVVAYAEVIVPETGLPITIAASSFGTGSADGVMLLCLPPEHVITGDDVHRVLTGDRTAEALAVYPFRSDLMLVRASVREKAVRAQVMLPLGEAKDAAKVAAAVESLYGVTAGAPGVATAAGANEGIAGESILRKWWFWTAVGVVAGAAVGVPVYLFRRDENGSTLGAVAVKP